MAKKAKQTKKEDLNININDLKAQANEEQAVNFSDREFLETADPTPFHTKDNVSSKYDKDREAQVQRGIANLRAKYGIQINPLFELLGKWWEVKPARAEIKKMLDAEAEAKGYDKNVYLQEIIGAEVDELNDLEQAISRMKYARTYFKPRGDYKAKQPQKQISIDGEIYQIPVSTFTELKQEFADDRAALKEAILEVATKVEAIEEL